jgi:hypothetical protein
MFIFMVGNAPRNSSKSTIQHRRKNHQRSFRQVKTGGSPPEQQIWLTGQTTQKWAEKQYAGCAARQSGPAGRSAQPATIDWYCLHIAIYMALNAIEQ